MSFFFDDVGPGADSHSAFDDAWLDMVHDMPREKKGYNPIQCRLWLENVLSSTQNDVVESTSIVGTIDAINLRNTTR